MQRHKSTKKVSELEAIAADSENLTSSLAQVIGKFNTQANFKVFDFLKSKGLAVSSLLNVLLILPFYGIANVYSLYKSGLHGIDFEGKKDVYYGIKNNEDIRWRDLLLLHAKRFIYLVGQNINMASNGTTAIIFDDTLLEKTGKKIEKASIVNDHVSGRFILGYKLLVCGFWDGASFIPLDFSLHREKGRKQEDLLKAYHKAVNAVKGQNGAVAKQQKQVVWKQAILAGNANDNPSRTQARAKKQAKAEQALQVSEEKLLGCQKVLTACRAELSEAKRKLKRYYEQEHLFGLTKKQRQEQYKKAVSSQSPGYKRRKEADRGKISSMLQMLGRVVKCGIVPDYVLIDSWFFCFELLEKLSKLKRGAIKLIAMVKINNQLFTVCATGKSMPVKEIINRHGGQVQKSKKLKAQYIKVNCFYKGIRVNLFFVRMGKCKTWHLLLTSDLDIGFVKLMEAYQIRWGIEVFFKESKQYLNLGSCQSVNFDAQIAETTISMMQHIMLSYFKRLNYQQSIGGLFQEIAHEIVELDLITRLIGIFWELMEILCMSAGVDFIEFQQDAIRNDEVIEKLAKLWPEKVLKNAA